MGCSNIKSTVFMLREGFCVMTMYCYTRAWLCETFALFTCGLIFYTKFYFTDIFKVEM